ncbi:GPI mannosyltransferase 1 [Dimargaris cristalligena]|uniref:GPI mannosyltransferase 1 n=1 Tax=Dimargaris cristalligena TaxID=215637 RepID=A0A4P9ZUF6_9FUNG|nr:GPI mannosyltransferase 1 [Dimargaris cristalligena]RKP37183.1 PIG-M-domain-containing protein [Dimargaris cristalligena]|eukprot:RKP37183.1 PIG-M-domain-containing protein [Dimargaris cristalligena]
MWTLRQLLLSAALLRLVLLVYGLWQDEHFVVKYTDVDYRVFTDAARFVWQGQSPYERSTYRYTPLLAWLLIPNVTLHPAFGKLIFVAADLAVGYLMAQVVATRPLPAAEAPPSALARAWYRRNPLASIPPALLPITLIWLWNPMVANISTRGNAESLMGFLVLLTLYCLSRGCHRSAALLYGLSVHFKIYPILLALPLMVALRCYPSYLGHRLDPTATTWWKYINRYQIEFALLSASVFFLLNAAMYALYGFPFLHETYLYHIVRKDHRHNFSIWFYPIYLMYQQSPQGLASALLAFIPQFGLSLFLGVLYADDLFFSGFMQIFTFVAYNKVVTSQYFMWYFSLLPMVLPAVRASFLWRGAVWLGAWIVGQLLWLQFAFLLEFRGENTYLALWGAGVVFFLINNWLIWQVARYYTPQPTFTPSGLVQRAKIA